MNPLNDYKVNGQEQNAAAREIVNQRPVEKYSIVVPSMWRARDQFVKFVDQLCQHPAVDEIIIIDNAHDHTPPELQHEKIHIFDFDGNIYVNPAWNFGVEISRNDRICIVNDDVTFDLDLFERLQYLISPAAGVFGLCPGVAEFNQPAVTGGAIDIVPWTDQHTYGFGCLMFLHKQSWQPIPKGLDIYFGDNYLFDWQLSLGKTNYLITNLNFYTPFAVTTSDTAITAGFLDKERIVYQQVKPVILPNPAETVMVQTTKKKRILIAIPTAKYIEAATFKSIYDLIQPDDCEIVFQYFFGYRVDQIRNLIADWVVKGFDYLFSVDSDISFAPDTLVKLLAHNRDMVSGLYIQRIPGQQILELYENNNHGGVSNVTYASIHGQGLTEVAACGFGCVLVNSRVMTAVGYPQFEYHPAIDHANTVSEDLDFCRKAIARGFKIWADTTIICQHTGHYVFEVDTKV